MQNIKERRNSLILQVLEESYSAREVAEIMGISHTTVYTVVHTLKKVKLDK